MDDPKFINYDMLESLDPSASGADIINFGEQLATELSAYKDISTGQL